MAFTELRAGEAYRPSRRVQPADVLEVGADRAVVRWGPDRVVEVQRTGHGWRWIAAHSPARLAEVAGILPSEDAPVDPHVRGAGRADRPSPRRVAGSWAACPSRDLNPLSPLRLGFRHDRRGVDGRARTPAAIPPLRGRT